MRPELKNELASLLECDTIQQQLQSQLHRTGSESNCEITKVRIVYDGYVKSSKEKQSRTDCL